MKILAWIGGGGLVLLIIGWLAWRHHFHHYTPVDAVKDLHAATQAGHSLNPAQSFLELRYGPQDDPANRNKAFKAFFNAGHIEGFYLIAGNRTDAKAKARVTQIAQIIADYRQRMSPADKAELSAYFNSDSGRDQIHEAVSDYESKNVQFRSVSAPVVQELMTSLSAIQHSSP